MDIIGGWKEPNDKQAEARFVRRAYTTSSHTDGVAHDLLHNPASILRDKKIYGLISCLGGPWGLNRVITGLGWEGNVFVISTRVGRVYAHRVGDRS